MKRIDWAKVPLAPPELRIGYLALPPLEIDERLPRGLMRMGDRWFRASDGAEVERPGWWEST